jgi:copper resistance protein C
MHPFAMLRPALEGVLDSALIHLEEADDVVRNDIANRRRRHRSLGLLRLGVPAALALAVLAMLSPGIASAHAYYISSTPKAGEVVKQAPSTITITFAENVNPQGSNVIVYDATHKQVSTAPAQVSRSNLKQMTVPMTGDGDGIYLVEWNTVSGDDGAQDIGGFDFMVNSSGTVDPSVGPLNAGSASTTTTGTSSGSGGVPVWLTIVIGLVALVVGAGGGYFATRRAK